MFVDRHQELAFLNSLLNRQHPGPAQLVLLYGHPRFITHLEQQRPRSAGGVIDRCVLAGPRLTDTDDLRNNAADLGRRVELSLALAALGGEVTHQVLVGIA